MYLRLSDRSEESLQSQIARQIRSLILTGRLKPGENLPSIRMLARDNSVSVITVQRAYESLMDEDLIRSRKGSGFYVCELTAGKKKAIALRHLDESIGPPLRTAVEEGLTTEEILSLFRKNVKIVRGTLSPEGRAGGHAGVERGSGDML